MTLMGAERREGRGRGKTERTEEEEKEEESFDPLAKAYETKSGLISWEREERRRVEVAVAILKEEREERWEREEGGGEGVIRCCWTLDEERKDGEPIRFSPISDSPIGSFDR